VPVSLRRDGLGIWNFRTIPPDFDARALCSKLNAKIQNAMNVVMSKELQESLGAERYAR